MNKKKITDSVRSVVLNESGFQCAYCGQHDGMNLTLHHIIPERDGGKTAPNNLIALCYNCHHRVEDTKTINVKDIRKLKRYLVHRRLTQAGVNALKIAYKNSFGVIATPFTVEHFLEENLLKHVETQMNYGGKDGITEATALYRITKKGKEMVELWIL
ncbi:MAG: HNH endonuclease [bacterium]